MLRGLILWTEGAAAIGAKLLDPAKDNEVTCILAITIAAPVILDRKYGLRICYEDPLHTYHIDLADQTSPTYPGSWRPIDPRGGRVQLSVPTSAISGKRLTRDRSSDAYR